LLENAVEFAHCKDACRVMSPFGYSVCTTYTTGLDRYIH